MAKKTKYYKVSDGHPASWLFGKLVMSEESIQKERKKDPKGWKNVRIEPHNPDRKK